MTDLLITSHVLFVAVSLWLWPKITNTPEFAGKVEKAAFTTEPQVRHLAEQLPRENTESQGKYGDEALSYTTPLSIFLSHDLEGQFYTLMILLDEVSMGSRNPPLPTGSWAEVQLVQTTWKHPCECAAAAWLLFLVTLDVVCHDYKWDKVSPFSINCLQRLLCAVIQEGEPATLRSHPAAVFFNSFNISFPAPTHLIQMSGPLLLCIRWWA